MGKKKKDKKDDGQAEAVDSIRAAIERGLQLSAEGAQATRERTRELVDEIASAAGRVRQSLEDMRVLDELRRLRTEVEALSARVSVLESPPSGTSTASVAKPATSRASRSPAKKTTARKATARKASASKSAATRSRAKSAAAGSRSSSTAATSPAGTPESS